MKKNRQQQVRADQSASHGKVTNPANGIYVDGMFVKPEDPLPDIRFPRSLRLMENRVILDDRVVIVLPYTRRTLNWLLAQARRWGEEDASDEVNQRIAEIFEAVEAHYSRWQPR